MRIGIIVEKFPSVSETFILNKVEGLARRGHQVVVFRNAALNDVALEQQTNIKAIPNLTLVDIALPKTASDITKQFLKKPSAALGMVSTSTMLMKKRLMADVHNDYFAKHPCDIYHFEFSGLALHYMDAFKNLKGKIVCSCRGTAEKVKPLTIPGRKEQLKQLFDRVDKIHCVSDDMAATIEAYGAAPGKIFVNRPAINTSFFVPATYKNNERLQIVSIGRLTFQKGYLIGLLAIQQAVASHPRLLWTIIGDGILTEDIEFYVHDLGLTNNVQLVGSKTKEQVAEYLKNADVFFLPSVYEGIANVVLEAMAMRLPVVSSDCSGMSEVIEHNVNGMLARNYSPADMATCIIDLLNHLAKRETLGKAARKTVEQHFSLERQLDEFELQYQQLLADTTA